MPTILLLAAVQPIYLSGIPDTRPARMRDLPTEVDGEIFGKWERMAERYNVDDQDGPPSLSVASQVNPTTSSFPLSWI